MKGLSFMWHQSSKRSELSKRKNTAKNGTAHQEYTENTDSYCHLELMFSPLNSYSDLSNSTCVNSNQGNSGPENNTIAKQIERMSFESKKISKLAGAIGISPEMVLLLQIKEMLSSIWNESQKTTGIYEKSQRSNK